MKYDVIVLVSYYRRLSHFTVGHPAAHIQYSSINSYFMEYYSYNTIRVLPVSHICNAMAPPCEQV